MSASPHRLLRASAGTGKTYQLVEAYAHEVLELGRRPTEIVAITFTRKAAAELRTRIRQRLLVGGVPPERLTELSRAPIANFHVLSLELLRTWGHTGLLPEGTQLLGDTGEDRLLFREACEEAWFASDSEVADVVPQLAHHIAIDQQLPGALWAVISQAREDGRPVDASLFAAYDPEPLRRAQHERLLALRSLLEGAFEEQTAKGKVKLRAFLECPVPALDAPYDAWATAWKRAAKTITRQGRLGDVYTEEHKALINDEVTWPQGEALAAGQRDALVRLSLAAWEAYERRKRIARLVDFADLIERAVMLLRSDPAVHRAVRERIATVLVDEAQDTNRLQRELVHLLVGLAGPAGDRETAPANLVVVGDAKQAIYTFRGADPQAFELFARDVARLGGVQETLCVSRRSTPGLVAGINRLGEQLFGERYAGEELAPLLDDDAPEGAAVGGGSEGPAMIRMELPVTDDDGIVADAREAGAVAAWIRGRVDEGDAPGDFAILLRAMTTAPLYLKALADQGLPALLAGGGGLYDRPEVVDIIALLSWLTDPDDRLSAAICLRSPIVGLSESALLELFAGSPGALRSLRRGEAPSVQTDVPGDQPALSWLAEELPRLCAAATVMGAAELIELADERLDLRAVYLGLDHGEQRVANIDRIWDLARGLSGLDHGEAGRFARQQRERIAARHDEPVVPVPAALSRAVTVSTVHQAKGLEWPVVVMSNLARRTGGDRGPLRYDREQGIVFRARQDGESVDSNAWQRAVRTLREQELAERDRLLYVATTRAQRQVIFFATGAPDAEEASAGAADTFWRALRPWMVDAERGFAPVLVGESAPEPLSPRSQVAPEPDDEARAWAARALDAVDTRRLPEGARLEIPVTTLEVYADCLRRGFLTFDVGLDEPFGRGHAPALSFDDREPPLDPFERGRLVHALLAAQDRIVGVGELERGVDGELRALGFSPDDERLTALRDDVVRFYGSELGQQLASLPSDRRRHEMPFQLAAGAGGPVAVVRGQIDLLAWTDLGDGDGPLVVDFKHARATPDGERTYALQLDAYAAATARIFGLPDDASVVSRLVFLRGGPTVVERVVTGEMRRRWYEQVREIALALASHRLSETAWPGQPRRRCEALGCGFVGLCHPGAPRATGAKRGQLSLF